MFILHHVLRRTGIHRERRSGLGLPPEPPAQAAKEEEGKLVSLEEVLQRRLSLKKKGSTCPKDFRWVPRHESSPPHSLLVTSPVPAYFHALTWSLAQEYEPPLPRHHLVYSTATIVHRLLLAAASVPPDAFHAHPYDRRNLAACPTPRACSKHEASRRRRRRERGRGVRAGGPDRPQEPRRAARPPPRTRQDWEADPSRLIVR